MVRVGSVDTPRFLNQIVKLVAGVNETAQRIPGAGCIRRLERVRLLCDRKVRAQGETDRK
jgi:hypothetical protein